jgi:hypothetical protein
MNIEDLVISLTYSNIAMNAWDQKLVHSFYDQISQGSGFTEKQSTLAIKTIQRHAAMLSTFMKQDISPFLKNPVFRLPIRKISNAKKMSLAPHPVYTKMISAAFPYNDATVERIRKSKDEISFAQWNKEEKAWNFALSENSLQLLLELFNISEFEIDAELEDLFQQVKTIHVDMEKHIPMLVIENKVPKIINSASSMPELETTDILCALFEARKRGVSTWDDTISNFLESDEVDDITRSFLKTEPTGNFHIDSEIHNISCLENFVKYMGPCLIVIPGGSEIDTTRSAYEFLSSTGMKNSEMSVMFRLPSGPTEIFNKFVKDNELNSPITEDTKIVFVSSKLPKPVLKSKIKFNGIINLGFSNVHYTMRDFVGKHENLVFYSKKKQQREMTFAFL